VAAGADVIGDGDAQAERVTTHIISSMAIRRTKDMHQVYPIRSSHSINNPRSVSISHAVSPPWRKIDATNSQPQRACAALRPGKFC
jgi:hypothetical protein